MLTAFGFAADSDSHDCRDSKRKHADTSTGGKNFSQSQFVLLLWLGEEGCPVVYKEALSHTSEVRPARLLLSLLVSILYNAHIGQQDIGWLGDTVYISD
jgi:hypothetical protein